MSVDKIANLLGDQAEYLLQHNSKTVDKALLHQPGPDALTDNFVASNVI